MDEFSQAFTLNDLIEKYQKEPISYISVHLLTDEFNGFVLAISWKVLDETHFKMFKQQPQSDILLFSHSLSEQYGNWHHKICQWLDRPHVPLKLINQ
jgi:hypothetical protein